MSVTSPPDRRRVFRAWALEEARKRTLLGFCGFAVQATIMIVLMLFLSLREVSDDPLDHVLSLMVLTTPLTILFWAFWYRESRKFRRFVTEQLNDEADAADFRVPKISPLALRYIPEIGLVVLAQSVMVIFLIFFY